MLSKLAAKTRRLSKFLKYYHHSRITVHIVRIFVANKHFVDGFSDDANRRGLDAVGRTVDVGQLRLQLLND